MASLRVLAFDHDGRPVQFDTWLDDLQLYLLSNIKDGVSLFDHVSGATTAPPTIADDVTRSQWLSRDTAASLAIRNHLPLAECGHFGQHRTAHALYDATIVDISLTGRLLLPYLFLDLSSFATIEDLVSHLCASDARYRAAVPAEFLDKNQPPMFITLYFIVTRLPESLRSVRDHFLSLDPTSLAVDLLEQHLLAAETSAVADVGAASASAKRCSGKGKGGMGSGGGSAGGGGGRRNSGGGSSGCGGGVGTAGGSGGALVAAVEATEGVAAVEAVGLVEIWGQSHTQHRYFSRLDDAWRVEFGDDEELPRWADLLKSRIAIFNLEFDAILSAMYALLVSAEGDCHRCVPPDPCIAAAALGASASGTLPCTMPAEALHTFTLDSGTSRCFFRDSTTLTPLPAPLPVRLADPSGGLVVARSSIVRRFRPFHYQAFTSPRSLRTWVESVHTRYQAFSDSSVAPPPESPLPATPSWHALSSSGLWSTQVSASSAALACPVLPSLRRGVAARRSSLLLVSPDDCSPADSPHGRDLPVLHLHSDTGGEFSSTLLWDFCRGEGILQSFTLPDSPQRNGIVECRIGLVMEVARTSMILAAAPHFLWPFAVRYIAHQLNLWPRVSLPETSPTLRWTGEVGDASVFWFYHPTSRRVFPSQDITFDDSVPFYRLFPYRSAPPPPPPLFLAPGPPLVDPLPPQGPAPSGVSQVDPLPCLGPVQGAVGSGAPRGAASGGAGPGSAESEGAEIGGAEPGGVATGGGGPGGAELEGVEPRGVASEGAEPQGATSSGGSAGASPRQSPQQLGEWFVRCMRLRSGGSGAGGAGGAGAGGTGVAAGAGVTGGTASSGPGGARTQGTGAVGTGGVEGAGAGDLTESRATGVGGVGPGGAEAVDPGGAVRTRSYFVPLLQQVLGTPPSAAHTPPLLCPPPDQSQPLLQPASPLLSPSPYTEQFGGLTERREPASRPVSPVRTTRRVPRSRPPLVPGTHAMTLRPSSIPLRVPLPAPPESSLPKSAAASALLAELLDFAAACRLDYATALVAESASASPPSVGGEFALGTDVLEDRQEDFESLAAAVPRFASMLLAPEGDPDALEISTPRSYAEAITGPYSSQWQAAMDVEMASWNSTGTYVDKAHPPWANIVDGVIV
ncbi:unnamed protein product [Closterium sp. NIES-53]